MMNKKVRQDQELKHLLQLRQENTGNTLSHDITRILTDPCVTKSSLYYRLRKKNTDQVIPYDKDKPTTPVLTEVGTRKKAAALTEPETTTPAVSEVSLW